MPLRDTYAATRPWKEAGSQYGTGWGCRIMCRTEGFPCPVAASRKYFSAIHTSPQLTSTQLTLDYVNNIILHLLSVLCTAINARNKN